MKSNKRVVEYWSLHLAFNRSSPDGPTSGHCCTFPFDLLSEFMAPRSREFFIECVLSPTKICCSLSGPEDLGNKPS